MIITVQNKVARYVLWPTVYEIDFMHHSTVTLTFNALSNQAPHVVSAEVAPVRPFECMHLQ